MRKALYTILFILSTLSVFAQIQKNGIPELEYFNRRQYNGATQNWQITQSNAGFMYFANNDGVLEFDGERWRMYDEAGDFIIRSVKSIGDRVYAGSFGEIGYFKYDSLFRNNYKSLSSSDIKKMGDFWNIYAWNDKVVFHSHNGLCIFKDDELVRIVPAATRFLSCYIVNGLFIIHDEKEGLMELRGEAVYPINGGKVFSDKQVKSVLALSERSIVIGTMKQGLYKWDMENIIAWEVPANSLLKQVNIFSGIKYLDDFLVYGTIQGGLVIISKRGDIYMQIDKDKGLKNNTVLSTFSDQEGNIWCGLDNGIARVNFNSNVTFIQGYYDIGTGYVIESFNGQYYFGTNQALYKISEKVLTDPLKKRDDFIRIPGSEGQVWSIYKDEENLLFGHDLGAFSWVNEQVNQLTPDDINGVWNFKPIPNHPNLLISGTYEGLCVFEKIDGVWQFKGMVEGFNESSRFLEWDDDGQLWMSHGYKGLYRLKFNEDFSKVLSQKVFKNTDVSDNSSSLVLTKINDQCLFTSKDGIYYFNENNNQFARYTVLDQFFYSSNYPNSIKQDQFNNIWYFHEASVGVLRYLEDGSYKKIEYPFLALERKLVSGFEFVSILNQDNAFFGIEDGFAHYSSNEIKNYQIPFDVHIQRFVCENDSVDYSIISVDDSPEQSYVPHFKFRKNAFQITYAASFMEGVDVMYATKLEGLDSQFSEWKTQDTEFYSNLREGEYTLIVRAKNRYGVEAKPVQFKFVVLPPWHRSTKAKVLYAVLLIIIALGLFYFIQKRVELSRQKEKLKQQQRFKDKEERLKNAALESEKELIKTRNDKLRGEMVFKEKELANSTIHVIQKNELLSDIKAQLKRIIKTKDHHDADKKMSSLIRKIDKDIDNENNWEVFEMHFGQVHEEFLKRLVEKHPELTQREQKLSAYIKMGMSSKEIASLMNITTRAVENNRYKLRQKLGIDQGHNLSSYIAKL
ncbi:ligand-binding sensor domain-containing protein [Labilibacter marinus]|uniref:ligand-binding sensor domain-containing protein n=1 Tax=Labilibacter marinus TaxID=1477105 RepID=UPI0009503221|nr:triple tyrosine motif-containing protein [Labilibacter marinus]